MLMTSAKFFLRRRCRLFFIFCGEQEEIYVNKYCTHFFTRSGVWMAFFQAEAAKPYRHDSGRDSHQSLRPQSHRYFDSFDCGRYPPDCLGYHSDTGRSFLGYYGFKKGRQACCFALLSSRLCGNARNHPPCTAPARCQCLGGGNHRQCACGSFACGHCATHDSFDRAGLWQGKQYSANDSGRSISG